MTTDTIAERFSLRFDRNLHRRWIGGTEVIIHCHHYNARIQKIVEEASAVDGKAIVVDSAEAVFAHHLGHLLRDTDGPQVRSQVVSELYAHLGFGRLDLSQLDRGVVTAPASHFVEGWRACFCAERTEVCSFTEGYLQGTLSVLMGRAVRVRETACMFTGAPTCRFEIDDSRTEPVVEYLRRPLSDPGTATQIACTSNVDERRVIDALVEMPIYGNGAGDGLIPAFNVYLANMPADYYNLLAIRFVEEMEQVHLGEAARALLIECAETCAINTFRGILASAEWDALIAPMIKAPEDQLFGLIAVSNALGWGDWRVVEHTPEKSLGMVSRTGYEASGRCELRELTTQASCMMLTGVCGGIMALLYGDGTMQERIGQFPAVESACRCTGVHLCTFVAEAA